MEWGVADAAFVMRSRVPRFEATLFESREGAAIWRCEIPNAETTVSSAGRVELQGDGYAEILEMSLPPWKLPIRELRWGRFATGAGSVVWIDWRGPNPLTLVTHDGVRDPSASVGDDTICWSGGHVTLEQHQRIRDTKIGAALSAIPLLGRRLPQRIREAREQKWCSRARLARDGRPLESGWAIHELVSFP